MLQYRNHQRISAPVSICCLLLALGGFIPPSQAERIAVSLSQEQDGGDAGRACIYVHNQKAEFRVVKADQPCEPEIMVENDRR